jgi:hypothetical protein
MNFQIVTYRNVKNLMNQPGEEPWVAACRPFPWTDEKPLRVCGPTPEEAKERMQRLIQQQLDMGYPELSIGEVSLTMSEQALEAWEDDSLRAQDLSGLKVEVVAYKGLLVIIPKDPEKNVGKNFGWYPLGQTRIGSVLVDTKKLLGVSRQAFELMKKIEVGRDCIGDIDWWRCDDGTYAFAWFGPIYRVIDPESAIAARGFFVTEALLEMCTIIPNDVPAEATESIDIFEARSPIWKSQEGIVLTEEEASPP